MKNNCIFIFILCLFNAIVIKGQNNSTNNETLSQVLLNSSEVTKEIYEIYDLDVVKYFKIDQYDTDLKVAVFKKTEEYKNKLNELSKIKTEILNKTYYVSLDFKKSEDDETLKYDLDKKGYYIIINSNWSTNPFKSIKSISLKEEESEKDFQYVYFESLPSKVFPYKKKSYSDLPDNLKLEKLFIPINEEDGLEIENNIDSMSMFFIFKISGKKNIEFNWVMLGDNVWYHSKWNLIKADKVRIIFANNKTDKIYFDKTYSIANKK